MIGLNNYPFSYSGIDYEKMLSDIKNLSTSNAS